MPQPYNYIVNPMTQFRPIDFGGIERGMARKGLRENQLADRQTALDLAESNKAKELAAFRTITPTSTKQQIQEAMVAAPTFTKQLGGLLTQFTADEQKGMALKTLQAHNAVANGELEVGKKIFMDMSESHPEGSPQRETLRRASEMIGTDPKDAGRIIAGMASIISPEFDAVQEKLSNRAGTAATNKLKVSQADLAKAQATGIPKEIALAEDKLAFNKLELAAKTKAEDAELMGFSDKPTAQDFVATQLAIEENNKAQVIATNLASKVGISDFGGSPTLWVEDFEKFWKGQSDEDIDVLRMELRQMGMLTAFSLKQAGSMSDQEKNDYLSTVPEKGASSKVWSGWLSENHKKSQQAYGALAAKRAFYDENKTMLKASKDMTLDVGGKPLEVKKGQYIRDIIRKEGVAMSRFAPKTGSTRKDLGSPNLSTPTSTTGTTGNLSTPPAWYQSGGSGKPSWDKY
jgi:hypothetical protein